MDAFKEVRLRWDGKLYTIPADRVMRAIAIVEDHVTLAELGAYSQRGTQPLGKLSMAFGALLRYAGARVTDEEVYRGMFAQDAQRNVLAAVETLLVMMLPPGIDLGSAPPSEASAADPTGGAEETGPSSAPRTKRRSRAGD